MTAPGRSAATLASRAACSCCWGPARHRMGIYLKKGANPAAAAGIEPPQPAGAGPRPWPSQGAPLRDRRCRGALDSVQVRSSRRGHCPGPPARWGDLTPSPAVSSGARGCRGECGNFRGNPGGLASCPDRLQTWAAGCWAREDGRQCRRELGGAVPFRPCTPSPESQEPLPPWASGGSGTLP